MTLEIGRTECEYKVLYLSISQTYACYMRHKLPPLSALRAFEAASYWENFAKAAKDLRVSHSAISQHIRALEEWLQVRLFKRQGNAVLLTEEGAMLRPKVIEAFELLDEACRLARRPSEEESVLVAAEPAFATRWLRPRLAAFREKYADINVYLYSGWDQRFVERSSIDVIVNFEKQFVEQGQISKRLFPVDGFVACAPIFQQNCPSIQSCADIGALPLIHDNSRTMWRRWFNKFIPGSDAWKSGYVYSDLSLAIDAALDGEGVFLADEILCSGEMATGGLVRLLPETMRCTWYCATVDANRASDSSIDTFLNWIVKEATECRKR